MPLYSIEIKSNAIIYADDEHDALRKAHLLKTVIFNDTDYPQIKINGKINNETDLKNGWDEDSIPYGLKRQDLTIKDILKIENGTN